MVLRPECFEGRYVSGFLLSKSCLTYISRQSIFTRKCNGTQILCYFKKEWLEKTVYAWYTHDDDSLFMKNDSILCVMTEIHRYSCDEKLFTCTIIITDQMKSYVKTYVHVSFKYINKCVYMIQDELLFVTLAAELNPSFHATKKCN